MSDHSWSVYQVIHTILISTFFTRVHESTSSRTRLITWLKTYIQTHKTYSHSLVHTIRTKKKEGMVAWNEKKLNFLSFDLSVGHTFEKGSLSLTLERKKNLEILI